ncbi:HAD family hydrolase [Pedobacter sp. ASV1-7]|uniref:HAD family hydrolase n=1 Tax=Pedobacter sp. ASV1-7 TaxID=3145237 RepID=UPI0032E8BF4E
MNNTNHTTEIKCIIFDCDNVLVDTESTLVSVLIDMAREYGAQMDTEEAIRLFSGRQLLQSIRILEQTSDVTFPNDFEKRFRVRLYDEFRKGVQPITGVKDLLESLKLPYCVASSGPREKIELNLGLTGLIGFFDESRIFSSYDIDSWKPDPDIFLHAASAMGFSPSECVVIEDSLAGIEAARNGGFRVYGLTNGYNQQELSDQGAIVFDEMKGLPQLLNI